MRKKLSSAQTLWLAYWRLMRKYFRHEVRGLSNLEGGKASLIVGYHGRPMGFDNCMLTTVIYEKLGYFPLGFIHRFWAGHPVFKKLIDDLGFLASDDSVLGSAISRGEHILVQPGGTREGWRG